MDLMQYESSEYSGLFFKLITEQRLFTAKSTKDPQMIQTK